MKKSTLLQRTAACMMLAFVLGVTARATDVLNVTSSLSLSDPLQLGRLSRNGVQQDWTGQESYPGVINTGTSYHFETFVIPAATVDLGNYFQISFDSTASVFVSAYAGSYDPTSKATNWLGDEGASGDYFGYDSRFFNVIAPLGEDLVLVVNNTAGNNGGVGDQFNMLVESFSDTAYDDARTPSVPDSSSSALLLGLGLAGLVLARRKVS